MQTIVALDIETTGLKAETDVIIELGAVKFKENHIEDEWTSLVNPKRPIPLAITQMTGITSEMVASAPTLDEVYDEFLEFIGNAPIVGHNISFDLSFLRRLGGLRSNPVIDTYEMAMVLLPGVERYALNVLVKALELPEPPSYREHGAHCALVDARLTQQLFVHLYEKAVALPLELLAEINRLAKQVEWDGRWAFEQAYQHALQQPLRNPKLKGKVSDLSYAPVFEKKLRPAMVKPLQPREETLPLDIEEAAAHLEHGGTFARYFSAFEHRPEQVEMLKAVARAISEERHLLVEAGTGTGKSLAYLVPAALFAVQNQKRVVISTNTINLQEQLIEKDIPDIKAALGLDLEAVVLKGRANYICPRRLRGMLHQRLENADQVRMLAKVLVWLLNTHSGDRSELSFNRPQDNQVWQRISADDEGCTIEACLKHSGGGCPFYRSRLLAQGAHLIVVNHALLLSDVALAQRVLPEYDYLIIDEGHHLEEATTNALSFKINQQDIERMIKELGGRKFGLLGYMMNKLQGLVAPDIYGAFDHLVEQSSDLTFRFLQRNNEFFVMLGQFLFEQRQGKHLGQYAQQERIVAATRSQPAWVEVEMTWETCEQTFKALIETINKIIQLLAETAAQELEEIEELFSSLSDLRRRLGEAFKGIHQLMFEPDPNQVYWIEVQPNGSRLTLQSAPLRIGSLMERYLWYSKSSVIVTSATLTAGGEFEYLKDRLAAYEAEELALGSPFDYENAALLYLVNDIPEPNEPGYQKALDKGLVELCKATGGRTLILFTSYHQLRLTAQNITPWLLKAGIRVLEQGEGSSRHALLNTFRETEQAVLLGTRSFWEGVDVPGEALSVLAITKLPFGVPTEPIIQARAETFDDPFNQYHLPEAILQFRQGFGRLIRSQTDRGVVIIFDKRVLSKTYGKQFLDSLPSCTKRVGSLAEMPRATVQWLNL